MNTKVFAVVGAILFVALGFYLLTPKEVYLQSECDLASHECIIQDENIFLSISLGPKPLDPAKPFSLTLNLKEGKIEKVKSFLFGLKPPYLSEKIEFAQKEGSSVWKGDAIFPYCTRSVMPWKLHFIIDTRRVVYKTNFKFEVNRNE